MYWTGFPFNRPVNHPHCSAHPEWASKKAPSQQRDQNTENYVFRVFVIPCDFMSDQQWWLRTRIGTLGNNLRNATLRNLSDRFPFNFMKSEANHQEKQKDSAHTYKKWKLWAKDRWKTSYSCTSPLQFFPLNHHTIGFLNIQTSKMSGISRNTLFFTPRKINVCYCWWIGWRWTLVHGSLGRLNEVICSSVLLSHNFQAFLLDSAQISQDKHLTVVSRPTCWNDHLFQKKYNPLIHKSVVGSRASPYSPSPSLHNHQSVSQQPYSQLLAPNMPAKLFFWFKNGKIFTVTKLHNKKPCPTPCSDRLQCLVMFGLSLCATLEERKLEQLLILFKESVFSSQVYNRPEVWGIHSAHDLYHLQRQREWQSCSFEVFSQQCGVEYKQALTTVEDKWFRLFTWIKLRWIRKMWSASLQSSLCSFSVLEKATVHACLVVPLPFHTCVFQAGNSTQHWGNAGDTFTEAESTCAGTTFTASKKKKENRDSNIFCPEMCQINMIKRRGASTCLLRNIPGDRLVDVVMLHAVTSSCWHHYHVFVVMFTTRRTKDWDVKPNDQQKQMVGMISAHASSLAVFDIF